MIVGIGMDLVELKRIKRLIEKDDKLVKRILTMKEEKSFNKLTSAKRRLEYVAGRFASKEAFAKAIGEGIGVLSFQHIEITNNEKGAPCMYVGGYESYKIH